LSTEIYSILRKITIQVNSAPTLEEARNIVITHVEKSGINNNDKQKMIKRCNEIKTLKRFLEYFYNALLKFEGDSVI
jgi:hypothetical protein